MSCKINKNGHGTDAVNVANDCVAFSSAEFTAINYEPIKRFTGDKNSKKVAVIFANNDVTDKATLRYSITANNARFNKNKEALDLDSNDDSGLFFISSSMTADDVVDMLFDKFGNFVDGCEKFRVQFGAPVHFLNDDGEIVKTILRIEDIVGIKSDGTTHRD